MKKISIGFIAFSIFSSIIFFSCVNTKQKQYAKIQFDSININITTPLVEAAGSPSSNLIIDYVFPVKSQSENFTNDINNALLNACFGAEYANLNTKVAVDSFKSNYIANYKEELIPLYQEDIKKATDNNGTPGWYSYYLEINSRPLVGNPAYLVYQTNRNEFSGGAHGNYSTFYFNFDINTGQLISLDDVFVPNYKEQLTDLLLNHLMQKTETTSIKELQEKAYLLLADMYPSENFLMSKDGILFFYNVYEIAPYSSGTTELTLSYDELKGLLK